MSYGSGLQIILDYGTTSLHSSFTAIPYEENSFPNFSVPQAMLYFKVLSVLEYFNELTCKKNLPLKQVCLQRGWGCKNTYLY